MLVAPIPSLLLKHFSRSARTVSYPVNQVSFTVLLNKWSLKTNWMGNALSMEPASIE